MSELVVLMTARPEFGIQTCNIDIDISNWKYAYILETIINFWILNTLSFEKRIHE